MASPLVWSQNGQCFDGISLDAFFAEIDGSLRSCREFRLETSTVNETQRLQRFYRKHAPYHVGSVGHILAAYTGRIDELYTTLISEWGEEGDSDSEGIEEDAEEGDNQTYDRFGFVSADGNPADSIRVNAKSPDIAATWCASLDIKPDKHYIGFQRHLIAGLVHQTASYKSIRKDCLRTFPGNVLFATEKGKLFCALHRVLTAASHAISDGYCQSMNFIAGVLLIVTSCEVTSYSILRIIATGTKFNAGYYDIAMSNCVKDQLVLQALLPETVVSALERLGVRVQDFTIRWFLCVFVDVVPFDTLLLLWDQYFKEGLPFLFRFSVAILASVLPQLQNLGEEDFHGGIEVINTKLSTLSPGAEQKAVMLEANSLRFSAEDLDRMRQSFQERDEINGDDVASPVVGVRENSPDVMSPAKKAKAGVKNFFKKK